MSEENPAPAPDGARPRAPQPRGYCWKPTVNLEPGMVIARPVYGGQGNQLTIHLAVGSAITASTIAQLINKGVECVAVVEDAPPDAAAYARLAERHEARLREIFGAAPDADCRPLFEALVEDGPCPC